MSIKWFRGAGDRVLSPRRDNPSAPKSVKPRKPKKLGLPKFPKVRKPRITMPFVQAVNKKTFLPNLSGAGLIAVREIAAKNHLNAGEVRWVLGHEGSDCPPAASDGPLSLKRMCPVLSKMSWPTLDAFESFAIKSGDGIWGASHINCRCHITVKLVDTKTNRYALYEVYTNPTDGADRGVTSAGGYAWASGTISESEIKELGPEQITDLNKLDSSDAGERAVYEEKVKRDLNPDWFSKDPSLMEKEPEGATTVSPAEPADEPVAEPVPQAVELEQEAEPTPEEIERLRKEEEEKQKGFLG